MFHHTKESLRELRDLMAAELAADKYVYAACGRTAAYICNALIYECDPDIIRPKLRSYAIQTGHTISFLDEPDFALAYEIIFGDISIAPLHINDALETVARWRLCQV